MLVAVLMLMTAIGAEVGSTALLPRTQGFHSLPWTLAVLGGYAASIWLMSVVVRTLPVSVVYAVWAGIGTAAVAVIGYLFLGEQMSWLKAGSLALIVLGVVALNASSAHA